MPPFHTLCLIPLLGGAPAGWSISAGPQLEAFGAVVPSPVPPGIDTPGNRNDLAVVMMSEASIGNDIERKSIGWTVVNRMIRNKTQSVQVVWSAYAHQQAPARLIFGLAIDILQGRVPDPTNGCTHFYSPISMPKEDASYTELQGYDVGGGLEQVDGLTKRNYRPSWTTTYIFQLMPSVRPMYYQFYRASGDGPVR